MKLHKRKDGYYQKRIKINGVSYSLYAKTIPELEKKYIDFKYNNLTSRDINVEKWSNKWLDLYVKNKAQATINMYKLAVSHIVEHLGFIKVAKLKQNDILEFLHLFEDKKRTQKILLLTIKQILNKAVENDIIVKNVANGIKLEKYTPKEKAPIPDEYIEKIKAIETEEAFMVIFMIYTGLRKEEVIPLQFKDINWSNNMIRIDKAVHFENNKPFIKETKNKTSREVPILDTIKEQLFIRSLQHSPFEFIFGAKNMLLESQYVNAIKKVSKAIDYKFTGHQLRHTYACILHKANIPLKEAQYFMRSQRLIYINEHIHSFR